MTRLLCRRTLASRSLTIDIKNVMWRRNMLCKPHSLTLGYAFLAFFPFLHGIALVAMKQTIAWHACPNNRK